MEPKERLSEIASELSQGKNYGYVSVREFLLWFNAQRRGYWVVERIKQILGEFNLVTEPDFESAYIDSNISFRLGPESIAPIDEADSAMETLDSSLVNTLGGSSSPPTVTVDSVGSSHTYADPTYKISKLAAANKKPVCVTPDQSLKEAVTIMLMHGFSQLPVMTGERSLKGVISWLSIGTRLALEREGSYVREFMDDPQVIYSGASIFDAVPVIVEHQYVLIRSHDNIITGIVTASDLSFQFQQLAEPFLLLGEIENHIRRIIGSKLESSQIATALGPSDTSRGVTDVSDLTFGEYIRIFQNEANWSRIGVPIDRTKFCSQLDSVRLIRNDVMHFDPDGLPEENLREIRVFARFLQRLQGVGVA
jgi:hypothetical protein